MPDDGDPVDIEHGEEVAEPTGERTERIVAPWFRGFAMTEQVGGDHIVVVGEIADHPVPCLGTPGEAVNEQDRFRVGWTGASIADVMTVDRHVLEREASRHGSSITEKWVGHIRSGMQRLPVG